MPKPEAYNWERITRNLQERLGITQAELAALLEVSVATIYRIENAKVITSLRTQRKILKLWEDSTEPKGFDYYLRERARILSLDASGTATSEEQKTLVVTGPTKSAYVWDFFSDGKIDEMHVSPGYVSRSFNHGDKIYKVQDFGTKLKTGQGLKIFATVKLLGSFKLNHEWTAFEIAEPTEHCTLVIHFPKERPCKKYSTEGRLGDRYLKELASVKKTKNGCGLQWKITRPEFKAIYTLKWDW
jgi:DNA-binding XRE family transcriptional regulator